MPKTKRAIFRVRYKDGHWRAFIDNVFWFISSTKKEAVDAARKVAKTKLSQLVIYLKNGRIQTEHTYPRSSDPRRSKG